MSCLIQMSGREGNNVCKIRLMFCILKKIEPAKLCDMDCFLKERQRNWCVNHFPRFRSARP